MSAAEIIELIKRLPPEEQAQVLNFAKGLSSSPESKLGYIPTDVFEKIAPKIFADDHELLRRLAQ